MSAIEKQKETARFWFETLRDRIVAAFETIENEAPGTLPAGRFQQTPWTRENDGGGRPRHTALNPPEHFCAPLGIERITAANPAAAAS